MCTATLVAPNLVLTARHCVSEITAGGVSCTSTGTPIAGGGVVNKDYAPSELFVYRKQDALADIMADGTTVTRASATGTTLFVTGTSICNQDLAFLVLDKNLPAPYAPVRLSGASTVGEPVMAVGYGLTEAGSIPSARRERASVSVEFVGPFVVDQNTGYGFGDSELIIGEAACSGDSGGPILSASGAVVGVASRVGGGDGNGVATPSNAAYFCWGQNAFGIYTHLSQKASLVSQAFAAAGHDPWIEGQPNPYLKVNGAACGNDGECQSNVCAANVCSASAPSSDAGADADSGPSSIDAGTSEAPTPDAEAPPVAPEPSSSASPTSAPAIGDPVAEAKPASGSGGCAVSDAADSSVNVGLLALALVTFLARRKRTPSTRSGS